jgi:hypothetical protein
VESPGAATPGVSQVIETSLVHPTARERASGFSGRSSVRSDRNGNAARVGLVAVERVQVWDDRVRIGASDREPLDRLAIHGEAHSSNLEF